MNLRPRMLTTTDEMEAIINEAQVCYVGMSDNNTPYVLPMNFAYADGVIFLHSAQEGQKIDVLKSNPLVSINFNTGNELF
ncbi:MAG: pyridoxamine 5'-phosphate oxidase family protein, partial [Bacteroidales bacterium]|nr:pyridoxamine 5'-phosphate oxidase family protein [Bacteroidales bacterium]